MKTYDDYLMRGLQGRELWNTIKNKCVTHDDMLSEMRTRQQELATYAKLGKAMGPAPDGVDAVQHALLRDIEFLKTMAWRLYMFGSRSLFSPYPGRDGEFLKRKRTDPAYWRMKALQGEKKADKWFKRIIRQEWEQTILRKWSY